MPKEKRSKLDPKFEPRIFIGYGEDQFGFRLWSLTDKKIIRSRDVIFNEKVFPHSKDETPNREFIPLLNTQLLYPTNNFSPTSVLAPAPVSSSEDTWHTQAKDSLFNLGSYDN